MTAVRSVAAAAVELGNTFRGQLLEPGNAGYEEARKVHNGLVDKRPALIAQCADATDVADAIRLTQRLGLEVRSAEVATTWRDVPPSMAA